MSVLLQIKEKEKLFVEKTPNVENENNSLLLTGKELSIHETGDLTNTTEPESEQIQDKGSTQLDGQETLSKDNNEPNSSVAANDTFGVEFSAVDSPPKFIIPKTSGDDPPNTSEKLSIVEKMLQEKTLCFAVEEAIKSHTNPVQEEKITAKKITVETTDTGSPYIYQETAKSQVVVHDVEHDQATTAKIKETPKVTQNNEGNGSDVTMETSSESSSEMDSEIDGEIADLESCLNNEQGNKKKKEININNVVRSLKERKSSVDETRELILKNSNEKKSNTLMLDDSNDESSPLLINESGDSSNESKNKSSKPDKSRRKGIPAKVCNRSSTSTESSVSSSESKSKDCSEVLDEVNGQFRRSSEDSDVTIVLVTENTTPQKDTPKPVRSVNLSENVSLSVVNTPSSNLVMECLDSDLNDQNTTDSSSKNFTLRPTARKTFPNNQKQMEICGLTKTISQSKPNANHPPPLKNLIDQTKVYEINQLKNGNPSIGLSHIPSGSKPSIGRVSAKLEEIKEKVLYWHLV